MSIFDMLLSNAMLGEGGGGGGGSSDFSTAQVTIVNNSDWHFNVFPNSIDEMVTSFYYNPTDNYFYTEDISVSVGATAVLNYCYLGAYGFAMVKPNLITAALSGNAEIVETTQYGETYEVIKVTGDCTITISNCTITISQ